MNPLLALVMWVLLLAVGPAWAASPAAAATVELWCVAKNNAEDTALLSALDWACGAGGADCAPIQQGGACYDAGDIVTMASFAFNSYFLKNAMADHSCFFDNNAALIDRNPSHDKCIFRSSTAVSNSSITSPLTAVGFGPSEDMSGCDRFGFRWFWPGFVGIVLIYWLFL